MRTLMVPYTELAQKKKAPAKRKHSGEVTCLVVLGGGFIATGSTDMTIKIWDDKGGKMRTELKGHIGAVLGLDCFDGEGLEARILSCSADRTARLWEVQITACM